MKIMKIMKRSTLLSLVAILVNCGGGDSSPSDKTTVSSLTKQARVNQASASSMGFREQSSRTHTGKMQRKANQKSAGPIACGVAGTYSYKTEATDTGGMITTYLNNQCQYFVKETNTIVKVDGIESYGKDENGVLIAIGYENYKEIPDINKKKIINSYPSLLIISLEEDGINLFAVNGEANFITDGKNIDTTYKYKNYMYISTSTAVHIQGSETIITPCGSTSNLYADYNGEFNFLTKHDSEPRYYKSGIIVVNGLKYDYRGEDVILSKDGETETVSQASILAEEDAGSSCSQKTAFSYEKIDAQKFKNGEYLNHFKKLIVR